MSLFTAIAAFKGAFIGSLLGHALHPGGPHTSTPQRPGFGKPCVDHTHSSRPGTGHDHGRPRPQCVDVHQRYAQASYPLFSLNR